ncbi:hypothetical protein O6H91_02G055900 [Diphasiastrum complanatum]|uniref:Uncharacterized protein n=1 Tax=Diphasiastrum complanatum TaxID=34168 RepID=A0ACC2EFP0_DIPCM|nr:hypothetical protein O6H91_02G055900 [Diphasiastrum complanatum]
MALSWRSSLLCLSSDTLDPSHKCSFTYLDPISSSHPHPFSAAHSVSKLPQVRPRSLSETSSSLQWNLSFTLTKCVPILSTKPRSPRLHDIVLCAAADAGYDTQPINVMISGAPASGKGTQSELIIQKYGLVHIAAGDLLRAEVAAGTENGLKAKEYMDKGKLVPNEVVVTMVKQRLSQSDAQEKGWLLDGYPRSLSQAAALEALGIRPHVFILLEVPEEILIDRVIGRRMDPVTGKIYHLKYSPPETPEIASRLTQRSDDTVDRVKLRLQTHTQNVEAVLSLYKNFIRKVDGTSSKDKVFAAIENILEDSELLSPGPMPSLTASGI